MSESEQRKRNPHRTGRRKGGDPLRPLRGHRIASNGGIKSTGDGVFTVPSESRPDRSHQVEAQDDGSITCGCEDFQKSKRRRRCKHGHAVFYALEFMGVHWTDVENGDELKAVPLPAEIAADLERLRLFDDARRNPIVEPQFAPGTATFHTRQKKAARVMATRFPEVLHEVLATEMVERPIGRGRPGLLLHDRAFCVIMRTFYNRPLADTCAYLKHEAARGLLPYAPSTNILCEYVHDLGLPAIAAAVQRRLARTVRRIETAVVIDSSSLSTCWSANFLDTGRGDRTYRHENVWLKAHVAAGPKTNVVSAIELTWNKKSPKHSKPENEKKNVTADVNFFLPLLRASLTHGWNVTVCAADKAYMDDEHYEVGMRDLGVRIYVPFRRDVVYSGNKSKEMLEMLNEYDWNADEFDRVYNAIRPKIEGVFSSTKRVTGSFLWSRQPGRRIRPQLATDADLHNIGISRRNEALAKFIVHSIRQIVLLECMHDDVVHFASDRAFEPLKDEAVILEDARAEMSEFEQAEADFGGEDLLDDD